MELWGGNFAFQSNDVDRARTAHEGVGLSLDVVTRRSTPFCCETSGVIIDEFSIYYKRYGSEAVLTAPTASDYWLSIPVAFTGDASGSPHLAMVQRPSRFACPGRLDPLRLPEHAEGLGLRIRQEVLVRRLGELTGTRVKGTITFASDLGTQHSVYRALASLAIMAARGPHDWSPLSNAIFRASFSDMMTSILLLNLKHSHSHTLQNSSANESLAVRRAIDYIHSNLERPVRLSELSIVSGVPVRTLSYQFNRTTGYSPLGYMRKARLEAARLRLQRSSDQSITELALELGFSNAGRFSGEYKARFGETPSQTRSRSLT